MNVNWIILGAFIIGAILLVLYLIKKNLNDKKDVTEFLNNEYKSENEEESELNNER